MSININPTEWLNRNAFYCEKHKARISLKACKKIRKEAKKRGSAWSWGNGYLIPGEYHPCKSCPGPKPKWTKEEVEKIADRIVRQSMRDLRL